MEKTKITKKDFYAAIITAMQTGETSVEPDEIIAFCEREIDALDRKAAKAKETAAKKKAEADALTDAVAAALTDEFETIATIAARIDDEDATVSKVTYRLGQLAKNGVAEKGEVKVDKRTLVAYKLA